jgi:hypothetical protein
VRTQFESFEWSGLSKNQPRRGDAPIAQRFERWEQQKNGPSPGGTTEVLTPKAKRQAY